MSRLIVSKLFWTLARPAIKVQAPRALLLSSAKYQLAQPTRFLASWGDDTPVDRKEIEFRVIKSIAAHDKVDQSQVKVEAHLMNDLGLDSLDQVEIIVGIEDEFKIEIEDVHSEKLLSVKDIVDFIVKHFETTDPPAKNPGTKLNPNMEFGNAST